MISLGEVCFMEWVGYGLSAEYKRTGYRLKHGGWKASGIACFPKSMRITLAFPNACIEILPFKKHTGGKALSRKWRDESMSRRLWIQ